jgi:glutamyl-tRNA synthetase
MAQVVTRIPPSPTGKLHIGTARTALFNYLYAKHHDGRIIFRSEDTDKERSKREFEDEIVEGLHWLGLSWDSFSRQSEHAPRHQELLEKIVAEGKAYISKEESKMEPRKIAEVVRLKNPGRQVSFHDEIRGEITFDTTELGDIVIARSISDPLYHFAVVVDDMDAGVSHVIRGEDHISNTTRQILIQEALGAPRPAYAHLPLILDAKRAKMSKRSGDAVGLAEYREEGFLPEGIINYLGLLGWNPGTTEEYFSLAELVEQFSLENVQKSGAVFDRAKLLSVNQHWMRKLSDAEFIERGGLKASDSAKLAQAIPLLKERAQTFGEARAMIEGELACLFTAPTPERAQLAAKEPAAEPGATARHLAKALELIAGIAEGASAEEVKTALMPYADTIGKEQGGRGAVLWPLRYALSGAEKSPDPFTLISILGKDESISRIKAAIAILGR